MNKYSFLLIVYLGSFFPLSAQDALGVFDQSIIQISERYERQKDFATSINHFKEISSSQSIRIKFFEALEKSRKIDWQILIESSSSGETFSYSATAYGCTSNKKIKKMEFEWITYFNRPKWRIINMKEKQSLPKVKESLSNNEYDLQDKISYPADLIIFSYRKSGKWNFRISDKPTSVLIDLMSFSK